MSEYSCLCSKSDDGSSTVKESDLLERRVSLFDYKEFLMNYLKAPLISGLREIVLRNPSDPIEFLSQWLLHFRECEKRAKELKEFEEQLFHYREKLRLLDEDDNILWACMVEGEQEDTFDESK